MIRCMAGALPDKDVLRPKGWRLALRAAIRNLNPGYFALVWIRHALFAVGRRLVSAAAICAGTCRIRRARASMPRSATHR